MREEASKVGLNISWSKRIIMLIDLQLPQQPPLVIEVCQNQAAVMKDFSYLGSILSSDGSVESDVNARIVKATFVLGILNNI